MISIKDVLNVCGGNISPMTDIYNNERTEYRTLHVDRCYLTKTDLEDVESFFTSYNSLPTKNTYINHDIFDFLERTTIKFDLITIYRFLEHVSFTQVLYFIYLISRIVKKEGLIDVIVPNYIKLATMLLNENLLNRDFEADNILLTTELLNEPSNPHASIWTPQRIAYYWELEKRFRLLKLDSSFNFDDRDIYLRALLVRL